MQIIKSKSDLESLNRQGSLPQRLIQFLEKTISEFHEAFEPETPLDNFSLEMYGPIHVLEMDQGDVQYLKEIGFPDEGENKNLHSPEWVEKIDLGDQFIWRIGILADNDYLLQLILPENEFGPEVEAWLTEQGEEGMYLSPSSEAEVAVTLDLNPNVQEKQPKDPN